MVNFGFLQEILSINKYYFENDSMIIETDIIYKPFLKRQLSDYSDNLK